MRPSFAACAFVAVVCLIAPSTFSQQTQQTTTPTTAASSGDVKQWMKQFGDEDWKVRDAAQRSLIAAGDGALEAVKQLASESTDPEVRQRADEIVRQLAAIRAMRDAEERRLKLPAEDRLTATLVTLKFDKAPPRKVYDSLAKQADFPPLTPPRGKLDQFWADHPVKEVTIDLANVPFWKALDELTLQTGLTIAVWAGQFVIVPADQHAAFDGGNLVFYDGPFRVIAPSRGVAGIFRNLAVFVEPKLRVLSYGREADVEEIESAVRGRRVPAFRHGSLMNAGGPVLDVSLPAELMGVPVTYVKGSIRAEVVTRDDAIEIDDIAHANNIRREINGQRIMLNVMEPEPGNYFVTLVAPAGPETPFTRATPRMLDDAGRDLACGGYGSTSGGNRTDFQLSFSRPPGIGPASKLILSFPAETREIRIPFEFGERGAKP